MRLALRSAASGATLTILVAAMVLGGCNKSGQTPAPARPKAPPADAAPAEPTEGKVLIVCEQGDAEVSVDGQSRGTAEEIGAAGGLVLPFGVHRFEIRLAGHRTFRLELDVGKQPETIRVKLQAAAGE